MWNKLLKKWTGKIYQTKNKRVKERYAFFKENAHIFGGKKVLDIGCNACLFTTLIAGQCKVYVGLEKEDKYYAQGAITIKDIGRKEFFIFNCSFREHLNSTAFQPNALILSRVLYYLSDDDIGDLRDRILPHVDTVLFVCGAKPKSVVRNSWAFHDPNSVMLLLKGFKIDYKWDSERVFFMGVAKRES